MSKNMWSKITREDVIKSINKFNEESIEFPEPKCTFLLYKNKKYPAKHIRGMAYEVAFGEEIKKTQFSGGAETVKFFERLGFDMYYTGKTDIKLNKNKEVDIKKENKYNSINLKVGLYLQTTDCHYDSEFWRVMEVVKDSDIDILVLPEYSYTPFTPEINKYDILKLEEKEKILDYCYDLSEQIGKAIVIGTYDRYGTLYTIYANANASEKETECALYIKHTMTEYSALEIEPYEDVLNFMMEPILYKNIKIGMTICYDCNHAIFSRIYGLKGIDVILNSTGGNIVYDKWYKFNKVRSIENSCYNFITMGGENRGENTNSYVYGFNPNGGELNPYNLMSETDKLNEVGTVYVYDTNTDSKQPLIDTSINQNKTPNKIHHISIPEGNIDLLVKESNIIDESIYQYKLDNQNIIFCMIEGEDILKPEKVLSLLYNKKLKDIQNKRYIIVNKFKHLDKELYETKLSSVLKVRAMENFCAVILESDLVNNCYQTGKNRTAQVVLPTNECEYKIDLERTSGPESIWKNKRGMKASYRKNIELLIDKMQKL